MARLAIVILRPWAEESALALREKRAAEKAALAAQAGPSREKTIQELIWEDRRTPPIPDYAYFAAKLKQKPPD